jgi:hypothetical protein
MAAFKAFTKAFGKDALYAPLVLEDGHAPATAAELAAAAAAAEEAAEAAAVSAVE